MTDDITANYHGGNQFSHEAFESTPEERRRHDRLRILSFLRATGSATCDEAEVALDMTHQTCSARFSDLKKAGQLEPTGDKRVTRSGRNAGVWKVADDGAAGDQP